MDQNRKHFPSLKSNIYFFLPVESALHPIHLVPPNQEERREVLHGVGVELRV